MKEIFNNGKDRIYHTIWQDRSESQRFNHSLVFPKATYSPWNSDEEFKDVYSKIADTHTLVDIFRCYELWSLVKQLSTKRGDIIEVGVWRGGTSAIIADAMRDNGQLFLCDTFEGVVKAGGKDTVYVGGEHADTSKETVIQLLDSFGFKNYKVLQGIFPEQTSHLIDSDVFKFCHIDVDVYKSALDIFKWVWPKLILGGMVVFDDYGFAACEGVTELVNSLASSHNGALKLHNLNGHGILIKVAAN